MRLIMYGRFPILFAGLIICLAAAPAQLDAANNPAVPVVISSLSTQPCADGGLPADPNLTANYLTVFFQLDSSEYRVNGIKYTMDGATSQLNDRIYVPVRYLATALGVPESGIGYDPAAESFSLQKGETLVQIAMNSKIMQVNGTPQTMDVSPVVVNERTYLPARWIAQAFGYEVEWSDFSNSVIIGNKVNFGNGLYLGDLNNGLPHGQGVYNNPGNGNRYMGEFNLGHVEGNGIYCWSNGDIYEGQFTEDHRSGWGMMYYANKDYYFGQWQNDLRNGWGKFVSATGKVERGTWLADTFSGPGQ